MTVCREVEETAGQKEEQGRLENWQDGRPAGSTPSLWSKWEKSEIRGRHGRSRFHVDKLHVSMERQRQSEWWDTLGGGFESLAQDFFIFSAERVLTLQLGQLWCSSSGQPHEDMSVLDVDLGESVENARWGVGAKYGSHFNEGGQ